LSYTLQLLRKRISFDTAVLAVAGAVPDDDPMHLGAMMWIGLGAAALVIGGLVLFRRKPTDGFGAVSEQWVMQHRAGPSDEIR
jgi:hypothetical protein